MKYNKFKSFMAACGLVVVFLGSTAVVSAQAVWCRWDSALEICKPTAPNGLCAVSGPNCDVPVVE